MVEYFLFIPFTLAILFDPISAALGAATGELVFSEIMLGQFSGIFFLHASDHVSGTEAHCGLEQKEHDYIMRKFMHLAETMCLY